MDDQENQWTITSSISDHTTGTGGFSWVDTSGDMTFSTAHRGILDLQGDDADIVINGQSLLQSLQAIEQRVGILRPNARLENHWDQLRELGEQYRRLEQELMEKQQMWDMLKKMPPPPIK
jgi:hypothetical protein